MSRIVLVNQSSTPDDAGSGNAQLFVEDNKVYKQVGTDSAQELTQGKVLQVVTVDSPEFLKTTSTTLATLGLSATLTPVASDSTFHISLKGYLGWTNQTSQGNGINAQFQFYRSNTALQDVKNFYRYVSTSSGTNTYQSSNPIQIEITDTPSTGSEITYHVDLAETGGSNNIGWCTGPWGSGHAGVSGQLVVMEIAG